MRRFLAYLGVEFRDPHQQALQKLKQRRAEQIAAYQDGESIADLATSVGVGPMKMSGFLVAQGVKSVTTAGGKGGGDGVTGRIIL